ncbi:Bug family tripartite tricarboxylate transporter substrate binding protein [Dankookia sp. GCM10030260]|uniref:Bug family tripartite tricarboxylate transporter substrate binding protein n=1 Tax=Dankookia sp. GCM10030260 TaxID=3273390 RepID=UPI003609325A
MTVIATRRLLLGAMLAAPGIARAAWPDRPIRLVVPFGGGGQTDIVSRVTAEALSARLGQPVLADNRPGGNGNLAAETVARAAPDGYTVLVAGAGTNSGLNALLYKGIAYDAERDFTPVGMFCTTANMLIVHESIPGRDFAGVLAWIKANPGRFTYASASVGAITHLIMEDIGARLGLDMVHVPYRQSTQAMADMLAGRVHARCLGVPEAEAIRGAAGVRPVALTTPARRPEWPGIPAMGESIPGFEASAYFGLAVPSRTPPESVQRLNAAMNEALRDEKVRAAYARVGADAAAPNAPEEFAARARQDAVRWGGLIRRLNLVAE